MTGEPDPFQHTRMSLGEHLRELRTRLFRGVLALLVSFLVAFYFYEPIFDIVARPMNKVWVEFDRQQRDKFEALLAEERKLDPSVPRTKYFASEDPAADELHGDLTVPRRVQPWSASARDSRS